ncbi:LAGLIDADG family homing endonuclease [Neobacillus drentensis]|uniref:LAGLIDADG family homing endonuclease n=1 Tax=Neobacillus drentensis TaxID=220684 RepID=UPI001F3E1917|nr:LAGLIDADG family homing endonuclease [Neobacillus drentensis]ULT56337.1 LAGLIDADG family homing endonuclease [Neobacillus drentensis]
MEIWEAAYIAGIIDGEGTITLTRMHEKEHRRPCVTIASTDKELLEYIQKLTNGRINSKKNYDPIRHKDSYTLYIKNKETVLNLLKDVSPFLRVDKKRNRALWILDNYEKVTQRNGKYNADLLEKKIIFEEKFFEI